MRAVVGERLGPPEVYRLVQVPMPEPGPGEVRLRVVATGLGYSEALAASGGYQVTPALPFTPGAEAAGVIELKGPDVESWAVGDRVTGSAFGGGLAERFVVPAGSLHRLPTRLSFEQGSGFRVNFATALHALLDRGRLAPGETLLVLGAAGGVGVAAVQLGKALGARVLAAASTPEKREFAIANGAEAAIDYTQPDWRDVVKDQTRGRGVDVVFDPVGGAVFEPAFRSLAWGGRHLVVGFTGGPIPRLPANLPMMKGAALVGVEIRQFAGKQPQAYAANHRELDRLVEAGLIVPPVGPVYPLERFREAMSAAMGGQAIGKVVVQVTDP